MPHTSKKQWHIQKLYAVFKRRLVFRFRRRSSESLDDLWIELEDAFERLDPVDVVENIINKDPRVLVHRYVNFMKMTPLHCAVYKRNAAQNFSVIELLVKRDERTLTMTDNDDNLPLRTACRNGDSSLELVQLLINSFPDSVRVKGVDNQTPLHDAVSFGLNFNIIKFIFDLYPEAAAERDIFGWTPLHFACNSYNPRQKVIELLLSRNHECIHAPNNSGFTPLMILLKMRENVSRETIQIVYEACPEVARMKVDKDPCVFLNAFHYACYDPYFGYCTPTAVQVFCDRDPCLFIMVHDESSMPWYVFHRKLKRSFDEINNNPEIYECVQHAAVSLVRKLIHFERKPLSHMEADVAEHLVELLETRPFPTLQELNTLNVTKDSVKEDETFQELQKMLCQKRFQKFLNQVPILLQARQDPGNNGKAIIALASVASNNNPDLLFHQLHKNPFVVQRS